MLCVAAVWAVATLAHAQPAQEVFLFAYFTGNGEDGLHLAWSEDGAQWQTLRSGASFLRPEVGESKLMRDPCIAAGPDGRYHMVWTSGWGERGIGYAHSEDLVHWSPQRYLPVMAHEAAARNCWAPELFYDAKAGAWLLFWATTIPGRFTNTRGETDRYGNEPDERWDHRMYYTKTKDFETFTPAAVLYDHGFTVIDATMYAADGRYLMFLKDETLRPAEKNIRIAWADAPEGPWSPPSPPISGANWAEGPTAVEVGGTWHLYYDEYTEGRFGYRTSTDLTTWTDRSDTLRFPGDARHGTVLRVPRALLVTLQQQP